MTWTTRVGSLVSLCLMSCGGSSSSGGGGPHSDAGIDASADSGLGGNAGFGGAAAGSGGVAGAAGAGTGGGAGTAVGGNAGAGDGGPSETYPESCAEAATDKTHFGCEFWPTVTPNLVWSIFDFAVIVSNPGKQPATVSVTQGTSTIASANVGAGQQQVVYLPWVDSLKGPDADECGSANATSNSVLASTQAYRLQSSLPVAVSQHNPIEHAGQGGPPGKNWSSCPGAGCSFGPLSCRAYSADSSLLLPTSTLGTSYYSVTRPAWAVASIGPALVITATTSPTTVDVTLSSTAKVTAGGGIFAQGPGTSFQLSMMAGDVFLIQGAADADLSGTHVSANAPIQVLNAMSCAQVPEGLQACDHLEETALPATLADKHYLIVPPTGPAGTAVPHVVRFVGHTATNLSYPNASITGLPPTLGTGQVVDLGLVSEPFEVIGDQAFTVATFLVAGDIVDPQAPVQAKMGDPAQSFALPMARFSSYHAFGAPDTFVSTFVDVIQPLGAALSLDGQPVTATPVAIGTSGHGIVRLPLTATATTAHVLSADQPVGVNVLGYGEYSSYFHPAGIR